MSRIKARYSRLNKPHKGNKHPGIYGARREIAPAPQKVYTQLTWNMPLACAIQLQEKYPELTLARAVKQFVLDNIQQNSLTQNPKCVVE